MQTDYEDIISRIDEPPSWFDDHSVPRYCEFDPLLVQSWKEAALVEIKCEHCARLFVVAFMELNHRMSGTIAEAIANGALGHEDPPWHLMDDGRVCVGNFEGTGVSRVFQYWHREDGEQFVRNSALEGPMRSSR